ncbi:TPA: Fe3+-citrate ABC transporter substrate-binding protein [Vibrio alginolyticus]|uniref:hypothetical protein n=1 Tax=Vibrio alginolyticus TaxID=663 RepID=UPI00063DBD60|nr:hypothetical protein [Vibrio alginolyticus]HCG6701213.1 Fe3+-citrate ABC transporter substrate-binding protein [Vibrio parahaemolyticus]KLI71146.1 hypothetical protein AAW26_16635 [Vibrio alginolyticus]MCQ9070888.1 Fe3+-citrate ABC transporter substrate-binding protein [Vibrio alginolyticus]MDM4739632.1 Fe3+-citrate ABC transporter substrate-binding protein [Vibrio alginolyticus]MDM4759981.1 Fe3+-citrate ABC transporter substrate-binding protein [Vibrio alginolyticus]
MIKCNYETNTGERFISLRSDGKAYKIHVHMPDDTVKHASVGCVKLGQKKGLKKAIQVRNKIGKEAWGKHWTRVLKDEALITGLPHNLEPRLVQRIESNGRKLNVYEFQYYERVDGKRKKRLFRRSVDKYGKMGAYAQVKRKIQEVYAEQIALMRDMSRVNLISLQ